MDSGLRKLEQRVLLGDLVAFEQLRRTYKRAGLSIPSKIWDLLIAKKQTDSKAGDLKACRWLKAIFYQFRGNWPPHLIDPLFGDPTKWRQVGGDVSAATEGCVLAHLDGDEVHLIRITRNLQMGAGSARRIGYPYQVHFTDYMAYDLELHGIYRDQITQAMNQMGFTTEEWDSYDVFTRAEILTNYGGYDHSADMWAVDIFKTETHAPPEEIHWWSPHTARDWGDEDESFQHEVMFDCFLCPRCISRTAIEEVKLLNWRDDESPMMVKLQRWPGSPEAGGRTRGGRCGCQIPLEEFQRTKPLIECKRCNELLENY